uniref:Uncharacterized protein n=1 Tax=Arundo donax TaxID=35708 RepID=A0A0A9EFY2_ARUDO
MGSKLLGQVTVRPRCRRSQRQGAL